MAARPVTSMTSSTAPWQFEFDEGQHELRVLAEQTHHSARGQG